VRQSLSPQWSLQPSPKRFKSPGAAAALNFFFPGLGYMCVGLSRDTGEVIFGGTIFVLYFIGFEIGYLIDLITYMPTNTPASVSPYATLILLAFLLPFAFAYDGYRRAKSP